MAFFELCGAFGRAKGHISPLFLYRSISFPLYSPVWSMRRVVKQRRRVRKVTRVPAWDGLRDLLSPLQAFLWGRNEPPLRGPRFDSQNFHASIQQSFTPEKCASLLWRSSILRRPRRLSRRGKPQIFMQLSQLEERRPTGAGLTHTLMASGACLAAAIPEGYVAAGGNGPLQFCYFRFCAGPEPRRRAGSQVGGNPGLFRPYMDTRQYSAPVTVARIKLDAGRLDVQP